jgi:tetratricopeptide (TPR) repeat protein
VVRHPSAPRPGRADDLDAEYDYGDVFASAAASAPDPAVVEAERERATRDLKRLLSLRTREQREQAIHLSLPGMRSPFLVEGLLDEAKTLRGAHPRLALELIEAAVLVVGRIPPGEISRNARFRLLTRVEGHRANALRLLGELRAADSAWRLLAERRAREPVELPDEEAELLSLEASLRIDLRQFETAERLLAAAERLYRSVGDTVGAARALIKRGSAAEYAGDGERAVEIRHRAAELLDPQAEPVLYLMCQMNLANGLVGLGRSAEAAAQIARHEELFQRHADAAVRLRRVWVEAHIARAQERFDEADRLLHEVRNGWLSHGRPYEAALVTLDAAELHFARGDWREVQRRAELLIPIFEANGVHREARAALILFQQAARARTLTADLLARLRRYLLLARNDRSFTFDPDAH